MPDDTPPLKQFSPGNATLLSGSNRGSDRPAATQESGVPGDIPAATQESGVPGGDHGRDAGESPGWHSRGYLPHVDGHAVIQHVTMHLSDSLPKQVVQRLYDELSHLPDDERNAEHRKRVDAWMDAGHGLCDLRHPAVAAMTQNALLFFDAQRYRLFAWVVMPNHVHVLFQPLPGWPLAAIVAAWKKFTAKHILVHRRRLSPGNATLLSGSNRGPDRPAATQESGVPGESPDQRVVRVWHREYWDRFIRDERHYRQVVEYIHQNPVKAGLVAEAEQWKWGSAGIMNSAATQESGVPGGAA